MPNIITIKSDKEISKILETAYSEALVIVRKEKKVMDKVVEALLKKETLDREVFEKIVGKKTS